MNKLKYYLEEIEANLWRFMFNRGFTEFQTVIVSFISGILLGLLLGWIF